MNWPEVQYDRSRRPLEFWAALISATTHPQSLNELDIEAAISLALQSISEEASAATKALALCVVGKGVMLLRDKYPDWSEWAAHFAIRASEWAIDAGEQHLQVRSESLFEEFVRLNRSKGA